VPRANDPSGWLDDVAEAAVWGASPIVVAVCRDAAASAETARWLATAVPTLAPRMVESVPAAHASGRLDEARTSETHTVFVVADASDGDQSILGERWRAWNATRDCFHERLRGSGRADSLVLLVTSSRMPEIALVAPELLGGSQVITVSSEPFAVNPADTELLQALVQLRTTLEEKYGMRTEEMIGRLLRREPLEVPAHDLRQWESVAQALRSAEAR